jgi:hypothetical protein
MQDWAAGRAVILIILLLALVFPPAAGYNVSSVHVEPSGALIPGTPVTAAFKVGWDAGSGESFPSENVLNLTTDLAGPRWTYTPLCSGPDKIIHGTPRLVDYDSYEPCLIYDSLRVTLEGRAPAVDGTTNRTIFRIQTTDNLCPQGSCFSYEYTGVVIDVGVTSQTIADAAEGLRVFRSQIEENTSNGIDTSAAEAHYIEAEQEIASARTRPATEYAGALANLDAARAAIGEGENALDKAWAEKSVADAQERIDRADTIISWFKGNRSTSNDVLLAAIIAKRDMALHHISQAEDAIYQGNYTVARVKAQEGYQRANESYTDALSRQYVLQIPASYTYRMFPIQAYFIAGIGVIFIAIVAIFLWKKRK